MGSTFLTEFGLSTFIRGGVDRDDGCVGWVRLGLGVQASCGSLTLGERDGGNEGSMMWQGASACVGFRAEGKWDGDDQSECVGVGYVWV